MNQFLVWITQQEHVPIHVLPYIQIRCMSCSGIELQSELIETTQQSYLHIPSGLLSEATMTTGVKKFSPRQTKFLLTVLSSRSKDFLTINLTKHEFVELVQHLDTIFIII